LNKGGSLYWRMLMNIKVKEVKPLNNLKLDVLFTNGIRKIYDVKKAMSYYEPFKELEDNPYLFKQANAWKNQPRSLKRQIKDATQCKKA